MSDPAAHPLIISAAKIHPVDRGHGVVTLPYVGRWNSEVVRITTGITTLQPGAGLPLHTHNAEESVLLLSGRATVVIGGESFELMPDDATWLPPGTEHRFVNRGDEVARIYWVYGGREITRTICSTGATMPHLSARDRASPGL